MLNATNTGTTAFEYDASGNVLVRRDPGSTTPHLGDTQVTLTGIAPNGVRYDTLGCASIAELTSGGHVNYLVPDRQGTDQLAITYDASETVTRRQYLPFGQARGGAPTWVGDYDPATGKMFPAGHGGDNCWRKRSKTIRTRSSCQSATSAAGSEASSGSAFSARGL